jgi:DNA mismatch endonuclease, patch repair protein
MARIRNRVTGPERHLRSALWAARLRGYRKQHKTPHGRPDLVFPGPQVAIFIDGCFWHGCPHHYVRPRSRHEFWAEKLRVNVERDKRQTLALRDAGWRTLRVWECSVYVETPKVVERVRATLGGHSEDEAAWRVFRVEVIDAEQDIEERHHISLGPSNLLETQVGRRITSKWKRPRTSSMWPRQSL